MIRYRYAVLLLALWWQDTLTLGDGDALKHAEMESYKAQKHAMMEWLIMATSTMGMAAIGNANLKKDSHA